MLNVKKLKLASLSGLLLMTFIMLIAAPANAIPYWARKYNADCSMCHWHQPKLNTFGKKFQADGYRITDDDPLDTSVEALKTMPVSIKVEPRFVVGNTAKSSTDFQMHAIELQIGAALSENSSIFIEKYLEERGEYHNAGDVFVRWMPDDKFAVSFGQFSLMSHIPDPERITINRNIVYDSRVSIGGKTNKFRLRDRQRGVSLSFYPSDRFTTALSIINGNADAAETGNIADDNDFKSIHLDAFYDLPAGYSLGIFGHTGDSAPAGSQKNRFYRTGLTAWTRFNYKWNIELITMRGRDKNLLSDNNATAVKSSAYSIELDRMFREGFVGFVRYGDFRTSAAGVDSVNSVQTLLGLSKMLGGSQKLTAEFLAVPGRSGDQFHFEIEFNL
ncbi:MAG: hypothetical protein AB1546_03775 [bacterium]